MSFGCDKSFENVLKGNSGVYVLDQKKIEFWCDVFWVLTMLYMLDQEVMCLRRPDQCSAGLIVILIRKLPVMSSGQV